MLDSSIDRHDARTLSARTGTYTMRTTHVCEYETTDAPHSNLLRITQAFNSDEIQGWEPESLFCQNVIIARTQSGGYMVRIDLIDAKKAGISPFAKAYFHENGTDYVRNIPIRAREPFSGAIAGDIVERGFVCDVCGKPATNIAYPHLAKVVPVE